MSSSQQIVFFDLPSREPCKAWSLNPWKTRLLLNYKGLDYRTEWVEYPDIKPKFEKHLPPNESGASYTIPTVLFPDGTYMQDSRVIATEIEKRHPNPPVQLDSPVLAKLEGIIPKFAPYLWPVYIPKVPKRILNDASLPYWYETRQKRLGMPLDQAEREKGGQEAWDQTKPYLQEVTAMLKEDSSGPYFLGKDVSYADFVWGGFLIFLQRIGTDLWEKFLETAGNDSDVHGKLVLALGEWSIRNDK